MFWCSLENICFMEGYNARSRKFTIINDKAYDESYFAIGTCAGKKPGVPD